MFKYDEVRTNPMEKLWKTTIREYENCNFEIHCMKQELFKEKHNRLLCTSPFIANSHCFCSRNTVQNIFHSCTYEYCMLKIIWWSNGSCDGVEATVIHYTRYYYVRYIYVGSMSVSSSIKSRNIMFMFYWAIGQTMENLLSGNHAVNFKTYCFTIPAQGHRTQSS